MPVWWIFLALGTALASWGVFEAFYTRLFAHGLGIDTLSPRSIRALQRDRWLRRVGFSILLATLCLATPFLAFVHEQLLNVAELFISAGAPTDSGA